ncbi:MAG: CBS domain-containing protein [Thermodesulfovibrionales bacterium]
MDVITSHMNADFDAFASMVAAQKLYPGAVLVFPGSQEKKVRSFISAFHPVEVKRVKEIDFDSVRRLIIVDTKSPDRIGPLAPLLSRPDIRIHVYDHHPRQEGDIHGTTEVIEDVGATATIFTEMLKEKDLRPTPMEATILSLGIHEETGSLVFPTTTERDIRALAYLLKCGASLKIVSSYLKTELSREELDLLGELTRNASELVINGLRIKVAKASRETYVGDAAHLANSIMEMEETDAVVLMLRMEGKVLMVGRSRAPELNIAEVLEEFGGGGHPTAAAASLNEQPLEILEEQLVETLRSAVRPGKTAADVMTRPVITTPADATLKEVEATMTRYGVNVLPVLKNGIYAGIISRENVEKALFHGFKRSRAADFASTDALTAEMGTPVRDIETTMIEQNQRFMPVLEGDRIVGAITRTDLLRVLYEDYLRRRKIKEPAGEERTHIRKNLGSWLRNKFPREVYETLRQAGEIADSLEYNAYVVGGFVRDLIRGEKNLDIDIVIEGDGIVFARHLAQRLGARVRPHERFGTAKVVLEGLKFDVASARTEYYEFPAALPKVEMSSIKKDLYRRDFTINTLAVKLNPRDFGQLVDFFGGLRDLKEKTIRVLHDLSFVEDPTRALRAVRFAERFGFRLSKHTERLLKSAVRMNLFERLSGARLLEELSLVFEETEPVRVIKRLSDYGLLGVMHPRLKLTEELQNVLSSLHETLLWFSLSFMEEKADRTAAFLMAFASVLNDEDRKGLLDRLALSPRAKGAALRGAYEAREVVRKMPLRDPAAIYEALRGLGIESLLFAMSLTDDQEKKKEVSRYLLELRKVRPLVDGHDLQEMGVAPGPAYSRILGEVLAEKLRGRLKSKEDEKRFVRQLVKRLPAPETGRNEPAR